MELVFGIILIVAAVFLIIAVLMQSGKSHNLSGAIAGGAETFFGKTKGKTIDRVLSKLTTVVAILFVIIVIVMYIGQDSFLAASEESGTSALSSVSTSASTESVSDSESVASSVTSDSGADQSADASGSTEASS